MVAQVKAGKTRQFWVEEELLLTKGNNLYVPRAGDLRKRLLHECHDTLWVGYPRWQRMYVLLKKGYFWLTFETTSCSIQRHASFASGIRLRKWKLLGFSNLAYSDETMGECLYGLHYTSFESGWPWGPPNYHWLILKVHHFHSHYQALFCRVDCISIL